MSYDTPLYKLWHKIVVFGTKINWCRLSAFIKGGQYWSLTEEDHEYLRTALRDNYFIIGVSSNCKLSTQFVKLLSKIKGSDRVDYSHVLMNTEDETAADKGQFKLIEATIKNVHYSSFMEVFSCDNVVLLKPKNMTLEDWTAALDAAVKMYGTPYDDVYNLLDATHVSCVEFVWEALKKVPDYELKFPHLVSMIAEVGNLTPQMLRDCEDFSVHWEVRR